MADRCVVCGKVVRRQAVRIAIGSLENTGWRERKVWGYAHSKCFSKAVSSPTRTIEELRDESAGSPSR